MGEFGYLFASSRTGMKKRDREKDCAKDLMGCLDQLPLERGMGAWCQLPPNLEKRDLMPDDLERVTKAVRTICPNATVEVPEPTSFVLVLEKFDPGFAELLREAR